MWNNRKQQKIVFNDVIFDPMKWSLMAQALNLPSKDSWNKKNNTIIEINLLSPLSA